MLSSLEVHHEVGPASGHTADRPEVEAVAIIVAVVVTDPLADLLTPKNMVRPETQSTGSSSRTLAQESVGRT